MHSLVRPLLFTAAIAGAVALTATPARAVQYFMHGSFCTGATTTDRSALLFNHFHAANDDATSARTVMCPFLLQPGAYTSLGIPFGYEVNYFDRSSTQALSCVLQVTDPNGSVVSSPERFSCATTGGCATNSDPAFASSQGTAKKLTINSSSIPLFAKMSLRCSVPAKAGAAVSGISDYYGSNG